MLKIGFVFCGFGFGGVAGSVTGIEAPQVGFVDGRVARPAVQGVNSAGLEGRC